MMLIVIIICIVYVQFCDSLVATEGEVKAYVGSTVDLPCKVDTKQCGSLHSVKWYKDTSRIYVLSQAGNIARAEGDDTDRMKVEYSADSDGAYLKISPVEIEDEATYKCEITYLEVIENCDVVQIVKLQTLIKPKSVRILGIDGVSMTNGSVLGPKQEGSEVDLICEALGGKPIPKVTWYNGTTEIKRATYTAKDDGDGSGTGRSKLQLTLSRGDLNSRFECRVESPALDEPITSWITVDVHVRPTKIELSGVKNHVVQGTNVLLICDVYGARPAATIHWANGSIPITDESLVETSPEDNRDGTFTTKSSLIFQASHWENGRTIRCFAENEVTKSNNEPDLQELLLLDVRYPPVISVKPLNLTVNETTSVTPNKKGVLLTCAYFANPQELKGVIWSKDGKNLTLSSPKYEGGTTENPPLIINNVSRDDMGEYSCWLKNEVGSEQSEDSIFLNVQYAPDVEVVMEPSVPIKAVDKSNVLLQCNVTSGNPSALQKVRWFLDGELMKEFPECNYTIDDNGNTIGSGGPFCGLDPSILSLERVDETFAGNYTCQGKNVAGWGPISKPAELIVYYPPSPAKLRHYPSQVVKGASVTLECTVDSLGRPDNVTYLWYRGSHQMTEQTQSNFTIAPVRLETKSNFTCIAQNEGGQSDPATTLINVYAPPAFIQKLPTYQGVLYSSQNINLTCRVECSPLCSIVWLKDGHLLDTTNNPLYYDKTHVYPQDLRKNDFESIESTLVWNMTNWPDHKLNKSAPNSNYTCKSHDNKFGAGVSSTIEIAVDYPPEDLVVSSRVVNVIEDQSPDPVKCHGRGHPNLSYKWRKNTTSEPIEFSEELRLGPLRRSDSGGYICEASNKHGTQTAIVYFNVQYAPDCSITTTEKNGNPALVCTAHANPQEVTFTWKIREPNDTSIESSDIIQEGLKSYLILDSSVDTFRTYLCYANNSVGISMPCERDVAGNLPWWKRLDQDKLIIIIASIIALIILVIIICIIIILLCRRKRADTKYNNPLEMEERENPDGHSPDASDQSKWPLKPGVLVHVNKLNNVSISQLTPRMSPFKTTSVASTKTSAYLKFRRNKSKVYARLEALKEFLGIRGGDHVPIGIREGAGGVVTFKKFHASPPQSPQVNVIAADVLASNPRKRKKPGSAPNPSSIGDKTRLGAAPPVGGTADPSSDPDKGFYENLPFHGMQNPPNKPISIIAPFNQGNSTTIRMRSSTKSLLPSNYTAFSTPIPTNPNSLKRNQSFHGFQSNQAQLLPFPQTTSLRHSSSFLQSYNQFHSQTALNSCFSTNYNQSFNPRLPFLSANFGRSSTNPHSFYRAQSVNSLNRPLFNFNSFAGNNPFSIPPQPNRIIGRRESQNIKRMQPLLPFPPTPPPSSNPKPLTAAANALGRSQSVLDKSNNDVKVQSVAEKRFNSLELKKHKCYSPTFYSMRCKKHAKKRPIVYALPKKCVTILSTDKAKSFENLTDSIQISEQSFNASNDDNEEIPVPKPRCKKHAKTEIIYQNVAKNLKSSDKDSAINSSMESALNENASNISVADVVVHATNESHSKEPCKSDGNNKSDNPNTDNNNTDDELMAHNKINTSTNNDKSPKLVGACAKSNSMLKIATMKNSPTLKVSPNFVKPKTESPKGALSLQIEAKRKASTPTPLSTPKESPNVENINESLASIPKMPLIDQNKWIPNVHNTYPKNAFYTLTSPHFKQLSAVVPPQYSATIPHQKHSKLIPRNLFQEQLPKSKSFSSKSKQKKHFQIPLQKCHSFKFQTAESYFQPIKNIHEENLMRNGYLSDYAESSSQHGRHHKQREKPKQKTKGPLVLRRPSDYQENVQFHENMHNSVQLQYPQPMLGRNLHNSGSAANINTNQKPNGVVYADLDMPTSNSSRKSSNDSSSKSKSSQKSKPKTEYATLKFNDIGQEIDV